MTTNPKEEEQDHSATPLSLLDWLLIGAVALLLALAYSGKLQDVSAWAS